MIDINAFTKNFLKTLNNTFGSRIWFVGLQGSYARGEATESSDIDVVVILDELNSSDIKAYNEMLDTLPERKLICGFLSGKNELLNWEPSDLFQFYHDTKALYGTLDELSSLIDLDAVDKSIKTGVCNIYHSCVHNMLYEKSEELLMTLYKSASFVIQAIYFKQAGKYIEKQKDLLELVSADEKVVIETFLSLKNGRDVNFDETSEILFTWAKKKILN